MSLAACIFRMARGLLAAGLFLAACRAGPTPTALPPAPTQALVTPTQTPAPTPTPLPPKTLTVCLASEPGSLYIYNGTEPAKAHVLEAIAEGPIDRQGYAAQPVILEALPRLADGSAVVRSASVANGDKVVDAFGNPVILAPGVWMWTLDPSTGRPMQEPVEYSGNGSLEAIQLEATYRLKPGLRWSDGEPLNADDSVFSFEVARSPETPTTKFDVHRTAAYVRIDDRTVQWTGLPGWLDTDLADNFWTPLPRHAYAEMEAGEILASPEVNRAPLGWGPFQVAEWVEGDHILAVRNPHYFRAGEGLPRLDQIVFRFVPDADEALGQLQAGKCDLLTQDGNWPGYLDAIRTAQSNGLLSAQFAPGTQLEHLDFNLTPAEGYAGVSATGLFADLRVRQALAYCVDRKAIVEAAWAGQADAADSYLPSVHPLFARDNLVVYPFDPERGRALLETAGWVAGEDGIRTKEDRRLSLEYVLNWPRDAAARAVREKTAELVQAQLEQNCGVETERRALDRESMYGPWPEGSVFGRRFDLAEYAWQVGPRPICDVYLSSAVPGDENMTGLNNTGYANPDFDAACLRSLRALDEDERRAAQALAQSIFTQELPSIPLYFDVRVMLARRSVTGLQLLPGGGSELWNIEVGDIQE